MPCSRSIPRTGGTRRLGRLPQPLTHAAATTFGSIVYLAGGRRADGTRSSAVWAIDPLTGGVRRAGTLPRPISDEALLTLSNAIIVAGGRSAAGVQAAVGELAPAS